jgi:ketosteroid isomerase-like protein
MSVNKEIVSKYIEGFNENDHFKMLSCLNSNAEWIMPGVFHLVGIEALDQEMEDDAFAGHPAVQITRMTEEQNVVVAEGSVRVEWKKGGFLEAVFCDVFEMENAKIKRLTTYQVNLKADSKEQISRGRGKPRVVVKA